MASIVELLVGLPTRDWGRMRPIRSDKLGELQHCFSLTTQTVYNKKHPVL